MFTDFFAFFFSQTPPFFLVSSDFLRGWFSGEPASGPRVSAAAAVAAAASLSTLPPGLSASSLVTLPYPSQDFDFNARLRCQHGCADPLKVHAMKRITPACWEAIRKDGYKVGTELSHHSLCFECVAAQIESAGRASILNQQRLDLASDLDADDDAETGFVVSKKFIHQWKDEVKRPDPDFNKLPAQINADILCDCRANFGIHGANLPFPAFSAQLKSFDFKANARFVNADVWSRLCRSDERFSKSIAVQRAATVEYLRKRRKIASDDIFCVQCRAKHKKALESQIALDSQRYQERLHVGIPINSFVDKFPAAQVQPGEYCIVAQSWFQSWSSFVQHGGGKRPDHPSDFGDTLLCVHDKLRAAPWPCNVYSSDNALRLRLHCEVGEIRLLQPDQFQKLRSLYPNLGSPITVRFSRKGCVGDMGDLSLVSWREIDVATKPEICYECAEKSMQEKVEQSCRFEEGTITFVPVSNIVSCLPAPSSTISTSITDRRVHSSRKGVFTLNAGISCHMNVRDLKMHMLASDDIRVSQLGHIFLSYKGARLVDTRLSLLDYRIANGSTIHYAIDETKNSDLEEEFEDFLPDSRRPERGFADSNFFKTT